MLDLIHYRNTYLGRTPPLVSVNLQGSLQAQLLLPKPMFWWQSRTVCQGDSRQYVWTYIYL